MVVPLAIIKVSIFVFIKKDKNDKDHSNKYGRHKGLLLHIDSNFILSAEKKDFKKGFFKIPESKQLTGCTTRCQSKRGNITQAKYAAAFFLKF
jgi:hypothetical protein